MHFASNLAPEFAIARLIVQAILVSLFGISLLIIFIVSRRWYRNRYFQKLNERTLALRSQWDAILDGTVPVRSWRLNRFDCDIVESILLDTIEVAGSDQMQCLHHCLRSSGLLDLRIREARTSKGWARRTALIALGRTRAEEAVPALAEALDSSSHETRMAAVRGLGRTGLPSAAVPILERLLAGTLIVPDQAVKNALVSCCVNSATLVLRYMNGADGPVRQLIGRVLAEVATPELGEDLILLATDENPELRSSAARAMANAQPSFAMPVLSVLIGDKEWFVRLRAVAALASIDDSAKIRPLLRALCDCNRYVRLKAAWALTRMDSDLYEILIQVVDTQDEYALQAYISELERSGAIEDLVTAIREKGALAPQILLQALRSCRTGIERAGLVAAAAAGGH
jgi:HEAT repeat protein